MNCEHINNWQHDLRASARLALSCLDLTSLNEPDTETDIAALCQRAQSPFGAVAAVCVWPKLAGFARSQLPAHISVAAVANFPDGSADIERALRDTQAIVQSGAQEVDLVLPYAQLLAGDEAGVSRLLTAVRSASSGLLLKVILETGELKTPQTMARAAQLSLDAGADFLKTSTGKTATSATPQAAEVLLSTIASSPVAAVRVGFKPSGGIRTVAEATVYIALVQKHLGPAALTAKRFRIGASSVLKDIEAILGGQAAPASAPSGSY